MRVRARVVLEAPGLIEGPSQPLLLWSTRWVPETCPSLLNYFSGLCPAQIICGYSKQSPDVPVRLENQFEPLFAEEVGEGVGTTSFTSRRRF